MYEWYQEYYVGAAHGLAGIYYYLMQVRMRTVRPESVLPGASRPREKTTPSAALSPLTA